MAALAERFPRDVWRLLSPRLSAARQARMLSVAAARTRRIRLVVQDVHQPHNVSACLRSADAFGVQDVDVVTLKQRFRPSTVARGVVHWLSLTRHFTVAESVASLRKSGYKIVAGVPRPDASSLYELPVDQPLAVVFGNEHAGIDEEWLQHVDHPFTIPMCGMVESLNISVSAAITLSHLTRAARMALGDRYHLSTEDQEQLLSDWFCRTTPSWKGEYERAVAKS